MLPKYGRERKRKSTNYLGHQICREVGASVITAALYMFLVMRYSVYSSPQLVSGSTFLLLQFVYTSVVVTCMFSM
jgi:hypothetical protein